jgi:TPR repeat protein
VPDNTILPLRVTWFQLATQIMIVTGLLAALDRVAPLALTRQAPAASPSAASSHPKARAPRAPMRPPWPSALPTRIATPATPARTANESGARYAHGLAVELSDSQALSWFREAAAHGLRMTQAVDPIGTRYESGAGLREDGTTAPRWYRRAAAQGDVIAETAAGRLDQYGAAAAVPPDRNVRRNWRSTGSKRQPPRAAPAPSGTSA